MTEALKTHEVRDLAWVFEAPGILSSAVFESVIESDEQMRALLAPYRAQLTSLDEDPTSLFDFLAATETHGRLGRYFENLLRYFLTELLHADTVLSNLQVRDNLITRGELDLVFKATPFSEPRHWEASVKFYLCVAETPDEARDLRYYMGTLVHDRFDRKLDKLLSKQLRLPELPQAKEALAANGLTSPQSRALLKGMLFYPSHLDWQNHTHPNEVSPRHDRGWWTTSGRLDFPKTNPNRLYMELPPGRWLSRFEGPVLRSMLMTEEELVARTNDHFAPRADGTVDNRILFRELMISEVEVLHAPFAGFDDRTLAWVRELTRGHVLHEGWPAIAREAAHTSQNETPSQKYFETPR